MFSNTCFSVLDLSIAYILLAGKFVELNLKIVKKLLFLLELILKLLDKILSASGILSLPFGHFEESSLSFITFVFDEIQKFLSGQILDFTKVRFNVN